MFPRILCGVDESPEAIEAVRQARRLAVPEAELLLVGVLGLNAAVYAGWAATEVLDDMRKEQSRHSTSPAWLPATTSRHGSSVAFPGAKIAATAREEEADLICRRDARPLAPGRNHRRQRRHLHAPRGSVLLLIARPWRARAVPALDRRWIRRLGRLVKRSPLRGLAKRSNATLRIVAAAGGEKLSSIRSANTAARRSLDHRPPVDALVAVSADADLVVIGAEAHDGLAAIGA